MKVPDRFPKVRSPYTRSENERGEYTVNNEVADGYDWVFDRADEVDAVEKLHGTNVAVCIDESEVTDVVTRMGDRKMNKLNPYGSNHHYIARGVQNSVRRGYMENLTDGWNFGELVGPKLHGNPYELDEHLFVPFDWLRDKCAYKSYGEYSTEFDAISEWFEEGLFSLFYSRMHGADFDESSVSNGRFVEGVVFVHPELEGKIHPSDMDTVSTVDYSSVARPLAKLRRDMYSWYKE